ncbi:MAG: TadE/TadG family type IV pilus assembly protein [Chloroflexota bacterium]
MTRSRQRGQSLVEVALVVPIVILMFMGIFDFGRAIFAYNSVAEAARNGSRVAIVNQTAADICLVAAERATGLGLPTACAGSSTAIGVWVDGSACTGDETGCEQLVRVNYQFRAITPIIGNFIGPITLTSTSRVHVESFCKVPPSAGPCPRT